MRPIQALCVCICLWLTIANGQALPYAPVNNNGVQYPWNNNNPMMPANPNVNVPTMYSTPNMMNQNLQNGFQFPSANVNPNIVNNPSSMMMPGNQQFQFTNQPQPNMNPMQPNMYPMQPNMYPTQPTNPQQPMGSPGIQQPFQPQPTPGQGVGIFSTGYESTYTTQQFRPPSRPQFSNSGQSGSFPSFPSFNSPPSFPTINTGVLDSMASTLAPSLTRGASQLAAIPNDIMSQAQDELAQSAKAAGMTTDQAQSIIQEAMQRGASVLTPPRAKPSSCGKTDFECQFYSACYSCYSNRNQPHCMWCVNLDNCAGDLPCQTQRACPVCQRLPSTETKPGACDLLKC